MSMPIDASALRDLVTDPAAAETFSAASGGPPLVVDAAGPRAAAVLAGLDITALPAVVVLLAPDPGLLPAACFGAADVILTAAEGAPAPFVRPEGGLRAGLDLILAAVGANPIAGTALALLLRSAAGLGPAAGLIAESATYSALQEGAEFRRWRASRPARPPEPDPGRVITARTGDELRITLSRPARRNAVDRHLRDALAEALTVAVADDRLRVVLTADGPDFCAGGDLDEFGSRPDPALGHVIRLTRSPALLLSRVAARTSAYLHGACLGAGVELPAFAGRVVAAPGTRLGLPEIGLGLVPGAGGTVSLPRRIGRHRTAYLGLTGRPVSAGTALRWGLVDEIGPLA
jgi:Enoyl-CoA hydratase/isomerase